MKTTQEIKQPSVQLSPVESAEIDAWMAGDMATREPVAACGISALTQGYLSPYLTRIPGMRMAPRKLKPVHPGDILAHDFMKPLELSSYKLAKDLGVSVPTVNEIVRRRRAVTAEMALRLSRYFDTTPHLWQSLQAQYDLEVTHKKMGKAAAGIKVHPAIKAGR